MCELHTGPKHPLSGEDTETYFDLDLVPLDTNQKERATAGTWRSISMFNPGRSGSLALVDCPPGRGEHHNKLMGRRDSSTLIGNSPKRGKL